MRTSAVTKVLLGAAALLLALTACGDDDADSPIAPAVIDDPPGPSVRAVDASPEEGNAPLTVAFEATVDLDDGDDSGLDYEWEFGDGGSSKERAPTHTYTSPGTYEAWLTVTDADQHVDREFVVIEVSGSAGGTTPAPAADISFDDWGMGVNEACADAAGMVEEVRATVDDPVGAAVVQASVEATLAETAAIELLGIPQERTEEIETWLGTRQGVADYFIVSAEDLAISADEAAVLQQKSLELAPLSTALGLSDCVGE